MDSVLPERGCGSAASAIETVRQIMELQTAHRNLLWQKKFTSSLAVGVMGNLYYIRYISVNDIACDFSISYQDASTLVSQLEGIGILMEITGCKRYIYSDCLDILREVINL